MTEADGVTSEVVDDAARDAQPARPVAGTPGPEAGKLAHPAASTVRPAASAVEDKAGKLAHKAWDGLSDLI